MQYIPIAAVPMTNTRGPHTTLLQRGREGEHQVEDHRKNVHTKLNLNIQEKRTQDRCLFSHTAGGTKEKETWSPESECRKGKR